MFAGMTVIVGRTEQEAQAKYADYARYVNPDGVFALLSGWSGIDFSRYAMEDPISYVKNDAVNSMVEAFTSRSDRTWTVRELVEYAGLGGPTPKIIGSPTEVADQLIEWIQETDVDGFNLSYVVTPESFSDFVELVIPELQRRGVYKLDYSPGTLREKLYGPGRSRLPKSHPAATYRYAGASNSSRFSIAGSDRILA
jgi:alkanesulfonate monooxygenase